MYIGADTVTHGIFTAS